MLLARIWFGHRIRCFRYTKRCLEIGGYHGLVGMTRTCFGHKIRCYGYTKRCFEIGGYHGLVGLAKISFDNCNAAADPDSGRSGFPEETSLNFSEITGKSIQTLLQAAILT